MASIGKQDSGKAELENRTVDTMVGDGSDTTLVLSSVPISINNVLIFISGVMQRPTTDYTLSGSTITFSEAPITGLKVVAITGGGEHIGIPLTKLGTEKFSNLAVTDAKIATGISSSKLTGALPALDGSALTGASGANVSGVDTVTTSDPAVNTNPASAGHIWLNRTSAEMFVCTDNTAGANVWINVGEGTGGVPLYMSATNTNGTEVTDPSDANYKVVTFNTSGSFTPSIGLDVTLGNKVEYLVIAGGGGGASGAGGGGGAGGYRTDTVFPVISTGYSITVGAGGTAGATTGASGNDSVFSSITSAGGGGGGNYLNSGVAGGSGGGGGGGSSITGGAASPSGQGSAGGAGDYNAIKGRAGGGGGGASAVGTAGNDTTPLSLGGNGGAGTSSSITGVAVTRAGGGGGGGNGNSGYFTSGSGGAGGGGHAGDGITGADSGTVNTGGGGGGDDFANGDGGSGVVIIRYKFQ